MKQLIHRLTSNRQVFNSLCLLFGTLAVAGFGFIFWTIVARVFSDTTVGLAATLLSLSSLISLLGLAGFDTTFVRFLPKSDRKQDYINSGLVISGLLSIVLSIIFLVVLALSSPSFQFVVTNPWYIAAFIFFNVVATLNVLTNSVFLAYRKAVYILVINTIFSIVKVVLPFMILGGNAMMIFIVAGIAQTVGLILSLGAMHRSFQHRFSTKIHLDIIKLSRKYALAVYGSSILNLIPPTILPLMLTAQLGAASSAYYYMTFTIASVLYTVAYSAMQSAFAEGSHAEHELKTHMKKAAKLVGVLMLPAACIVFVAAPWIMSIFGPTYVANGTELLQLFCVSALFVSVYSALGSIFKIRHTIRALVAMNLAYAGIIIGLSYALFDSVGVNAVGVAWLAGNVAAVVIGAGALYMQQRANGRGSGDTLRQQER